MAVAQSVEELLRALNVDPADPNFSGTPDRVARAYAEVLAGQNGNTENEIRGILSAIFPCDYDEMVSIFGIKAWGLCPHHLLPASYNISIGYIPDGKVIGLSKLPRLAILLTKRLVLQEQLTVDIVNAIERASGAKGVICLVEGEHLCMRMRGVRAAEVEVVTSTVRGVFSSDLSAKTEFLSLWQNYKKK